jgi:hypothetical protein
MSYYLKYLIISLLCWHIFIFYVILIILNNEYIDSPFCICGSNPITNTFYICAKNIFSTYLTHLIPGNVLKPYIIDPYTYIFPIKVSYSDMLCYKN